MLTFLVFFCIEVLVIQRVCSANIDVPECPPPDYPQYGGYGPRQEYYTTGDFIHYFCDIDTYIGGNFRRVCLDNGDWSGDTPVCDSAALFSTVEQSSTADPSDQNGAESASDGIRSTCSSTAAESAAFWKGTFEKPSQVIRVMLFLPKADVNYEVLSIKEDGREYSCGRKQGKIERLEWVFHNCLEPNNTEIKTIKIKSLSKIALQLCEVFVHTLTEPTCTDPHYYVENGRLQLSRKTATLVCDRGYRRSRDFRLQCVRNGVWTRKTLYCAEHEWESPTNTEAQSRQNSVSSSETKLKGKYKQ